MWEEALKTDTYATASKARCRQATRRRHRGRSAQGHADTAMVGVANLGNADNLTGHHFAQANLYAFGRQAWDWTLDSEDIADDWVRMTWSNDATCRRHGRRDDDGLARGAGELSDPAGRGAPVHLHRPLRPQPVAVGDPGRLQPRLLQQGRQRRRGLQPLSDRQQLRRPVLPDARAALREHRHHAGEPARRGSTTWPGITG